MNYFKKVILFVILSIVCGIGVTFMANATIGNYHYGYLDGYSEVVPFVAFKKKTNGDFCVVSNQEVGSMYDTCHSTQEAKLSGVVNNIIFNQNQVLVQKVVTARVNTTGAFVVIGCGLGALIEGFKYLGELEFRKKNQNPRHLNSFIESGLNGVIASSLPAALLKNFIPFSYYDVSAGFVSGVACGMLVKKYMHHDTF